MNICISRMKNEKEVQEAEESCYLQGGTGAERVDPESSPHTFHVALIFSSTRTYFLSRKQHKSILFQKAFCKERAIQSRIQRLRSWLRPRGKNPILAVFTLQAWLVIIIIGQLISCCLRQREDSAEVKNTLSPRRTWADLESIALSLSC